MSDIFNGLPRVEELDIEEFCFDPTNDPDFAAQLEDRRKRIEEIGLKHFVDDLRTTFYPEVSTLPPIEDCRGVRESFNPVEDNPEAAVIIDMFSRRANRNRG